MYADVQKNNRRRKGASSRTTYFITCQGVQIRYFFKYFFKYFFLFFLFFLFFAIFCYFLLFFAIFCYFLLCYFLEKSRKHLENRRKVISNPLFFRGYSGIWGNLTLGLEARVLSKIAKK